MLRTAALRVADALVTMKVEKPVVVVAATPVVSRRGSLAASERGDGRSVMETIPEPVDEREDVDVETAPRESAARDAAAGRLIPVPAPEKPMETIRPEDIPPEPDVNPWETTEPAPDFQGEDKLERRPPVEDGEDRDMISPLSPEHDARSPVYYRPGRIDEEAATNPRASIASGSSSHSAAEHAVTGNSMGSSGSAAASRLSLTPASVEPLNQGPHGSPTASRLSLTPVTSHSSNRRSGSLSAQQPGLEVVRVLNDDDGLIPVVTPTGDAEDETAPALDCKIDRDSSFSHFRGFCEGAREALRLGDFGVKKNRKGASSTCLRDFPVNCAVCLIRQADFGRQMQVLPVRTRLEADRR